MASEANIDFKNYEYRKKVEIIVDFWEYKFFLKIFMNLMEDIKNFMEIRFLEVNWGIDNDIFYKNILN